MLSVISPLLEGKNEFFFTDGQDRITRIFINQEENNITIRENIAGEQTEVNLAINEFITVAYTLIKPYMAKLA